MCRAAQKGNNILSHDREADGAKNLDEVAALAEAHFAPWLVGDVPTLKGEPGHQGEDGDIRAQDE